jgi:hypothetical protein
MPYNHLFDFLTSIKVQLENQISDYKALEKADKSELKAARRAVVELEDNKKNLMEKNDYLKQKLLEKKEKIDNNLLRFLTVRVKKFDLNKNYFRQEN